MWLCPCNGLCVRAPKYIYPAAGTSGCGLCVETVRQCDRVGVRRCDSETVWLCGGVAVCAMLCTTSEFLLGFASFFVDLLRNVASTLTI